MNRNSPSFLLSQSTLDHLQGLITKAVPAEDAFTVWRRGRSHITPQSLCQPLRGQTMLWKMSPLPTLKGSCIASWQEDGKSHAAGTGFMLLILIEQLLALVVSVLMLLVRMPCPSPSTWCWTSQHQTLLTKPMPWCKAIRALSSSWKSSEESSQLNPTLLKRKERL